MSTAVETMQGVIKTLKKYSESTGFVSVASLDDAVKSVSTVSSLTDLRDKFISEVTSTEKYSVVKERLKEVCGIVLGGEDVGAVTSANAGGSTVKTSESIVPEEGNLSTAELPTPGATIPVTYTGADGKSFTFYVKYPDSFTAAYNCESESDYLKACDLIGDSRYFQDFSQNGLWGISAENLTDGVKKILRGLNGWWLRESAKLAYDSLGIDIDGKTVLIQLAGGGGFLGAAAATDGNAKNGTPSDVIYVAINLGIFYEIDAENPNGTGGNAKTYLDRVIAHEMVHGVMCTSGTIKDDTPEFFREGIAEFVIGADDENAGHTESIPRLAQDSDTLLKNLAFAEGYLNTDAYPAGYMFLRYLCKQNLETSAYFIENSSQTADFNGNNTVINNISEVHKINYNTTFFNAYSTKDGKDFVIANDEGNLLVIRDAADKTINFVAGGKTYNGFMTSTSGNVGSTDTEIFTGVFGANYKDNEVFAGKGGSYLWGGFGGNDTLHGGNGADIFYYAYGDGNDNFINAENQDSVIVSAKLEQISAAQIDDNGVNFSFVNGNSLNISGQVESFTLYSEGSTPQKFRADYQTKAWQQA